MHRPLLAASSLMLAACSTSFVVVDREPSDRSPLHADCDALDPGRCLLPWPSNTFTVADPATATGLRLAVGAEVINPRDDVSSLARADGFSRVSPVLAHFDAPLDEATLGAGVRLLLAQHDHPERGRDVPLRTETLTLDDGQTLLLADPLEILAPNADYVVVVTSELRHADGSPVSRPRAVDVALAEVALAEVELETADEAARAGYHAPTRALLAEVGVPLTSVRRVWDFTTRSADAARRPLESMRDATLAAIERGDVGVAIDEVQLHEDPSIAAVVVGRLTGVPTFLADDGGYVAGPDGLPTQLGTVDAPFRVLLPVVTEDYRFVMYGHGTGGDELDDAFDTELAGAGIAKVSVRIYGWTGLSVLTTFAGLQKPMAGTFAAASFLLEALAHGAAVERAMTGVLGDALSAEMLGEVSNPVAGLRPDGSTPMWVGGSLGGAIGLTYAAADPAVRYAVLNVPAAAFSQWLWHSDTVGLVLPLIAIPNRDHIDLNVALAIAQTNLNLADGATWVDVLEEHPTAFLIQESIGDNILPNPGTEMVAITASAAQVGGVLEPIHGLRSADEVLDASGITQFRAPPSGGMFDVHGFAALDTPAGAAAREQIAAFVTSAFAGQSRIAPPASCPASCDFSGP